VIAEPSMTPGSKHGTVNVADAGENSIDFDKLFNSRNQWLPLEHIELGPDGKQTVTYPFLKDKHNMRDRYLIGQVATIEPYKMKYGETGPAWKAICENLKTTKYESNLVFQKSLNPKTCKDRFTAIMDVVGRNQGMVSFNTGCDDEETPDEFHALDELYSRYKEATQSTAESKAESNKNSLAKKKKELAAAEEIRQVGLGNLCKRDVFTPTGDSEEDGGFSSTKKNGSYFWW
jgi:hypothetical protein